MSEDAEEPKEDPLDKKLNDLRAKLGEQFSDYFMVVRTQDGLRWVVSDQAWAMGAIGCYSNLVLEKDRIAIWDRMDKGNG